MEINRTSYFTLRSKNRPNAFQQRDRYTARNPIFIVDNVDYLSVEVMMFRQSFGRDHQAVLL